MSGLEQDTFPGIHPDDEVDPTAYFTQIVSAVIIGQPRVHREPVKGLADICTRVGTRKGATVVYDSNGEAKVIRLPSDPSLRPIPLTYAINLAREESPAAEVALTKFTNQNGSVRFKPSERGLGRGPRIRQIFKDNQLSPVSFQSQCNRPTISIPAPNRRPRNNDLDNGDGVTWD